MLCDPRLNPRLALCNAKEARQPGVRGGVVVHLGTAPLRTATAASLYCMSSFDPHVPRYTAVQLQQPFRPALIPPSLYLRNPLLDVPGWRPLLGHGGHDSQVFDDYKEA